MALSSLSAIEKELECPLCLETMTSPKIVGQCFHSFCKGCISDHIFSDPRPRGNNSRYYQCPVCRKQCRLPKEGVDGLKDDFRAVSMISNLQEAMLKEALEANKPVPDIKPRWGYRQCYFCELSGEPGGDATRAMFECDGCDLDLCADCQVGHITETSASDGHYVFEICPKHQRRMKHFCRDCSEVLCIQCWKEDHTSCCPLIQYKDITNQLLCQPAKEQEEAQLWHGLMKHQIDVYQNYVGMVKSAEMKYVDEIQNDARGKIDPIKAEIESTRAMLERLKVKLQKLETEKASQETTRTERVTAVKKCCGDFVSKFDSIQQDYATTTEVLDGAKWEVEQLQHARCLGPKHHEGVVTCKRMIDTVRSSLERISDSIYHLGVCKRPEYPVGESMWSRLTSALGKLEFL